MATKKQINYYCALSKRKGQEFNEEGAALLGTDQLSEIIEKLEKLPDVPKAVKATMPAASQAKPAEQAQAEKPARLKTELAARPWNPVQAGMVKKCLAGLWGDRAAKNPQQFATVCAELYEAFEAADAAIKASHPEVEK